MSRLFLSGSGKQENVTYGGSMGTLFLGQVVV